MCSSHTADNNGCFDHDRRARFNAFVAKRKAYLVRCSLLTLQGHADNRKLLVRKAQHFNRLNVVREGLICWRLHHLQVSDPLLRVEASAVGSPYSMPSCTGMRFYSYDLY